MTLKYSKTPKQIVEFLQKHNLVIDYCIVDESPISNVFADSSMVDKSNAFICYKGVNTDLHKFIPQAIDNSCPLLIIENQKYRQIYCQNVSFILVKDSRKSWSLICSFIHNHPQDKLYMVGITGTNGKTSTVNMISNIYTLSNMAIASIGTLGIRIADKFIENRHTTPDPNILFNCLAEAVESEIKYIFMEVSSHAISQKKISPIIFDIYCLTSFSQDHLDFHKTMEHYFLSKTAPIRDNVKSNGIVVYHRDTIKSLSNNLQRIWYQSIENKKTISIGNKNVDIRYQFDGNIITIENSKFQLLNQKFQIASPFIGNYSNSNLVLAIIIYLLSDPRANDHIKDVIPQLQQIPGRMELISKKPVVIVDYAHTPDAISNLLITVKSYFNQRICLVFGCGGDRDKSKRKVMGEISEKHASLIILTNDNPRGEDPLDIIQDIRMGLSPNFNNSANLKIIPDREEAIKFAITERSEKNTIVIAGKGHENFQQFKNITIPFDDRETAKKYLQQL